MYQHVQKMKKKKKSFSDYVTFSLTSSSASTSSPSSVFSLLLVLDGIFQAFLIELRPKNVKSATAVYSPTGSAKELIVINTKWIIL